MLPIEGIIIFITSHCILFFLAVISYYLSVAFASKKALSVAVSQRTSDKDKYRINPNTQELFVRNSQWSVPKKGYYYGTGTKTIPSRIRSVNAKEDAFVKMRLMSEKVFVDP